MLKVNQTSINNRQVSRENNLIVWTADAPSSNDKYVALFNAQNKGDNIELNDAIYKSQVLAGRGASEDIKASIQGAKNLILYVNDGGDGFDWDHVAWVDPVLSGPKGELKLTDLEWSIATAGWGEPHVDRTCDNRPLRINNQPATGIGTHSKSLILFELPAGYDTFSAKGVVTQNQGSVVFELHTYNGSIDMPKTSEVKVNLEEIGITGEVKIRDLWQHKDLGTFSNEFSRELPMHGAGLFKVTLVE
jgi:hypothetical protein